MNSREKAELIVNWKRLRENSLSPELPEHVILKELSALNKLFISGDGASNEYGSSDEIVSAYTLFYLPTNIPKFFFILKQLPLQVQEDFKQCHFIDIGTGPGTYLLAFLAIFSEGFTGDIIGIDRSDKMLSQAKKLLKHFFPEQKSIRLLKRLPDSALPGKKILFLGHSINEIGVQKAMDVINKVAPDHIFIIEPGTRRVFKEILTLRRELLSTSYETIYPCPAGVTSCPMDNIKSDDWCHQVLRETHHPDTERLSQLFSKDRRTMPLISHVYSKTHLPDSSGFGRLVRRVKETKFSHIWEVCTKGAPAGIVRIEIMKKGVSREQKKIIKATDTGSEVKFTIIKKIEPGYWRVELGTYTK